MRRSPAPWPDGQRPVGAFARSAHLPKRKCRGHKAIVRSRWPREDDPISVDFNVLFRLGKGPQAGSDQRTYRYWVAVTERNKAILSKEYFDLPVTFEGTDRAQAVQEKTLIIPRGRQELSGSNFEILIGFEVTPEMADFNRDGKRFCVDASATDPGACVTARSRPAATW